jgi:hypothetical protein
VQDQLLVYDDMYNRTKQLGLYNTGNEQHDHVTSSVMSSIMSKHGMVYESAFNSDVGSTMAQKQHEYDTFASSLDTLVLQVPPTLPKLQVTRTSVYRGSIEDNYWNGRLHPSWGYIDSNSSLYNVVAHGCDASVLDIKNLSINSPTTEKSCAEAAEQKLLVDLTTTLAIDYKVTNKATIMRYSVYLPDRICMGCSYNHAEQKINSERRGVSCKAGHMVCGNCNRSGSSYTISDWIDAGFPCRHLQQV